MQSAEPKTKNTHKLFEYLQDFIRTDYFQDGIKKLRIKYNIPENGYEYTDDINIENICLSYKPKEFTDKRNYLALKREFEQLWRKKIKFYNQPITSLLLYYLFHNHILEEIFTKNVNSANLYLLEDEFKEMQEMEPEVYYDTIRGKIERFPLSIRIHPKVSQRGLVDFIKNNWERIEKYQKRYADKLPEIKTRKRSAQIRKRDDFIYQYKDLPREQINKLLKEHEFKSPGYAEIGKIISLETKKRKGV